MQKYYGILMAIPMEAAIGCGHDHAHVSEERGTASNLSHVLRGVGVRERAKDMVR